MRCPECNKPMKTDVINERYICTECGNEISWSKPKDLNISMSWN